MITRICRKCNEEKEICEFGKNKAIKDGFSKICKNCDKIKSKIYRLNNKEKVTESRKKTYEKNKKKYTAKSKEYYLNNKEKIILQNKKNYHNNIDEYKKTKKIYREKNKDKLNKKKSEYGKLNRKLISEKDKIRRKTDPLYRTIKYVRNRINSYIKKNGYKKDGNSFKMVGCSPEKLKSHIEQLFTEGMSWDKMGNEIHIDHIIPLSSARNIEELFKLCHYTNLQPLWAKDNLTKGKKIIEIN